MSEVGIRETRAGLPHLLRQIEQRFDVVLEQGNTDHLRFIAEHYAQKREMLMLEHGLVGTLRNGDYAKALLISEAAKMMVLREIDPRPRKKKKKKK